MSSQSLPMREFSAEPGVLLCLNLLCAHESAARQSVRTLAEEGARYCIHHARERGWSILHVHSAGARIGDNLTTPIAGLEPLSSEPVFYKHGPSAFSARGLEEAIAELRARTLALIGFALPFDCLATSVVAFERGLRTIIVRDAVGPAAAHAAFVDAGYTHAAFAILGQFSELSNAKSLFPEPGAEDALRLNR